MWLLKTDTAELRSFQRSFDAHGGYAILSHTWEDGQELTYQELLDGTGRDKSGFEKIRMCAEIATQDELQYIWIGTCCIDKKSSAELQEVINSMF